MKTTTASSPAARLLRALLPAMLLAALVDSESHAAELALAEGWNAWRVAAGESDATRCCYSWSMGNPTMRSCDLDKDRGVPATDRGRRLVIDEMQIYAFVESGTATRVTALSPQCAVTSKSAIVDHGLVPVADSLGWLQARLQGDDEMSEDVLNAIAAHESGIGVLIDALEDRRLPMRLREQALLWLAQSDADRAYEYLTTLLTGS